MAEKARKRILNVDDDDGGRYAITRILTSAGFDVLEAATGMDALRLVKERPDLVVLDVNLPDINGFEVCKRIKANPSTAWIPVVHLSATLVGSEERAGGLEGGADGYLVQPVDPRELVATVKAFLRIKEAEEKARTEAAYWQSTFDAIRDGICLLDDKRRILRCNRAFADLVRSSEEEITGRTCWEIMHGTTDPIEDCPFLRASSSHRRESLDLEVGDRWFSVVVDPLLGESGELVSAVYIMFDITDQRNAEQTLRESEERFRSIFEYSPAGMAIVDLNGKMLRANCAFRQMLGYTEDELLRMRFYDFTHPDDREMNRQEHAKLIAGEIDAMHIEKRYLRKDGGIVWASVHASVIRDVSGKPLFTTDQALDITERREAREKIEQLNRVLRAIRNINQLIVHEKDPYTLIRKTCELLVEPRSFSGAFIIVTDEAGVPRTYAEAGVGDVFQPLAENVEKGILPPCCEGARFHEGVYLVADRTHVWAPCPMAADGQTGETMCFRLEHDGKTYGYAAVSMSQGHVADEEEQSLFAELAGDVAFSLHNIERENEARRAEEERRKAEEQLRQAQKIEALGTLAGGIAHDFNNILGIIVSYTEMACWDAAKGSTLHGQLQEILKATARAKDLVTQILAFSLRSEHERKPMQIGLIVKEALKMLRASLPSSIEIQSEVNSKAVVLADPSQMHQVLMNLCTNAAHAMQDSGGVLEVSLSDAQLGPEAISPYSSLQSSPQVKLTVKDTGHGIDPAILDRIFDPFFTTKEVGVGTGLGLAVVHGIVKSHGGAIEVDSFPGKGTIFQVFLPAVASAPVLKAAQAAPLPRGQERILVVDDEPVLAMAAKIMLEHLGYEVDCRASSIEALEAFRSQPPDKPFDLVITDMTMPQMTGVDIARELHRLQPGLPVILCTGFSEKINAENTKSLGIQGFLMKPAALRELAELVRKVLDERVT